MYIFKIIIILKIMLFFSTEQLQSQGVSAQDILEAAQIKCSGRVYNRVSDLEKTEREAATAICRNFIKEGVFGFICETLVGITVWREEKNHNTNQKTSLSSVNTKDPVKYDIVQNSATIQEEPKQSLSYQTSYEVFIRKTQYFSPTSPQDQEMVNKQKVILENEAVPEESQNLETRELKVYRGVSYDKNTLSGSNAFNSNGQKDPESDELKVYRGVSYENATVSGSNAPNSNGQKDPESKKASKIYRGISY